MRPVLRPGATLLRRDPDHLQLGTSPGDGVIVADRPGLVDFLRLLDGVHDIHTVLCVAQEQLTELRDDPAAVLDALRRANLIVDADLWDGATDGPLQNASRSLAARGVDPSEAARRLRARTASTVEIRGDTGVERLAAQVVGVLESAGVRALSAPQPEPTIVVSLTSGEPPRSTLDSLTTDGITHLVVTLDATTAFIGPLVLPGQTPCVRCVDRYRADWDDAWPALIPQFEKPLQRPAECASPPLDGPLEALVAAAVAGEVLAACDRVAAATTSRVLRFGPTLHDRGDLPTDFHPDCDCRRSAA